MFYYFTLGMAALMWTVAARQMFGRRSGWFRWYSLTSVVLAIASPSLLMWTGAATSVDVGLFQRVSFGILGERLKLARGYEIARYPGTGREVWVGHTLRTTTTEVANSSG